MTGEKTSSLSCALRAHTESLAEAIGGPTLSKGEVVNGLLDVRNLGHGVDVGLELTVDDMLQSIPGSRLVSSEWWLSCLDQLADHAAFLAAGYPAVSAEMAAA